MLSFGGVQQQQKQKYTLISRLGRGAHGSVVKAKDLQSERIVALKQIPLKGELDAQLRVFREVQCLRHCNHANIIQLLDVVFSSTDQEEDEDDGEQWPLQHSPLADASSVSLVLEFVESSLRLIIDDERRPPVEAVPRHFFTQILYAVAYLHHIGIMHRDLKPDNILVTAQNQVRIADFGLACIYFPGDSNRVYDHQVATRWYRAPELLFGAVHYTPSVDLWALGCIFVEFFNGEPLFAGKSDIEQLTRVFALMGTPTDRSWPGWELLPDASKVMFEPVEPVASWAQVVSNASPEGLQLIRSLLLLDPEKRASALSCLELPFFSQHPMYDQIPYKPPLMEHQPPPPEIVFREAKNDEAMAKKRQQQKLKQYKQPQPQMRRGQSSGWDV